MPFPPEEIIILDDVKPAYQWWENLAADAEDHFVRGRIERILSHTRSASDGVDSLVMRSVPKLEREPDFETKLERNLGGSCQPAEVTPP